VARFNLRGKSLLACRNRQIIEFYALAQQYRACGSQSSRLGLMNEQKVPVILQKAKKARPFQSAV
jgi:hypothetical protein